MISALHTFLAAEEPSLWQEIWDYLYNTYFTEEAVHFENLNFGSGSMINIRSIVFGLLIGIIIASFIIVIDKRVLGAFIRKLLREECLSPESAKRLCDLGFVTKHSIRNGVRRGTTIRSVVRCVEEEEYNEQIAQQKILYEEKRKNDPSLPPFKEVPYTVDPDSDHFYIPEAKKYSAEMRFEKKGTTWLSFAMVIVLAVIGFVFLLFIIPEILKLLDDFVGIFTSSSSKNILT